MTGKGTAISKLIEAIRQGSLHRLTSALDDGCDIEEADPHGHPGLPLRTACFSGKIEIVRELINRGANINAAGADGPGMPLRLALRARNADIIGLLLSCGAEVPADVTLPADLLNEAKNSAVVVPEIPSLEFVPAPKESTLGDFLPEHATEPARPQENYPVDEEVDITANYGVDTNLLNMDMLRFDEEESKADTAAPEDSGKTKKASFWKSGRRS